MSSGIPDAKTTLLPHGVVGVQVRGVQSRVLGRQLRVRDLDSLLDKLSKTSWTRLNRRVGLLLQLASVVSCFGSPSVTAWWRTADRFLSRRSV